VNHQPRGKPLFIGLQRWQFLREAFNLAREFLFSFSDENVVVSLTVLHHERPAQSRSPRRARSCAAIPPAKCSTNVQARSSLTKPFNRDMRMRMELILVLHEGMTLLQRQFLFGRLAGPRTPHSRFPPPSP
jgi:hypothetical protein